MAHKQIKKKEDKFIKIGAKTYKVLKEETETKFRVLLISVESKFNTPIGNPKPFMIDLSRLNYQEVEK